MSEQQEQLFWLKGLEHKILHFMFAYFCNLLIIFFWKSVRMLLALKFVAAVLIWLRSQKELVVQDEDSVLSKWLTEIVFAIKGEIYMADYIDAHAFSSNHMQALLQDKTCGCFYCFKIFSPAEITDWVPDSDGTAICPYCGIDSVIGESAGYPITEDFLKKMKEYWF